MAFTKTEHDRKRYEAIKADPEKRAAYNARKLAEHHARVQRGNLPNRPENVLRDREKERIRRKKWRDSNPATNRKLRDAQHAVELAILRGDLIRAQVCCECGKAGKIHAHHWSYEEQNWLNVEWLCTRCHGKRHRLYPRVAVQSRLNETERG